MGASNISQVIYGKTLADAYNNACQEATYEHGHDSYNGTISTTRGVKLVQPTQKQITDKYLRAFQNASWDRTEKWGHVEALALPHKYYKGRGHGVRAWLVCGWAAE